jgi:NAD(P)-dependent dehydrogenase (short-subunit alcohol dehydrogenase family)
LADSEGGTAAEYRLRSVALSGKTALVPAGADAASYVTGQTLDVSGGLSMW